MEEARYPNLSRQLATEVPREAAAPLPNLGSDGAVQSPCEAYTHLRILTALYQIGALQFGDFVLKSGRRSPLYVDLRLIVSYPRLLAEVTKAFQEQAATLSFDCLCGVPYTAIPLATALSLAMEVPLLIRRKERKAYGRKRQIEGAYRPGMRCLLIEDLITTGASLLETVADLETEGLQVTDLLLLLDREEGGREALEAKGYAVHPLFTLSTLCASLEAARLLSDEQVETIHTLLSLSV